LTYYGSYVSLWGFGEQTAGFLIIGLPCLPKTMQSLPGSDSVASLFRSLKRSIQSNTRNDSDGPSNWRPRVLSPKHQSHWEIADGDTFELETTATGGNTSRQKVHPANGIIREVRLEVSG